MQTRLRETTHQLMRALEAFYPFVKQAEEQISMLEGDLDNLTARKKNLDNELAEKIKQCDMLIALDKKKIAEKLAEADMFAKHAQELYFELYKAKTTRIVPPPEYGDKLAAKVDDLSKKVKKEKEAVNA